MSGFVANENNGCSIEAMSSFGTASAMSRTKKSRFGWRSGSKLISDSLAYQELSRLAYQEPMGLSKPFGPFGTKVWPFRNQSLALSEPGGNFILLGARGC